MRAKVINFRKPCEWCGRLFVPHDACNSRFCDDDCTWEFTYALLHWASRRWVEKDVTTAELALELDMAADEITELPDVVA